MANYCNNIVTITGNKQELENLKCFIEDNDLHEYFHFGVDEYSEMIGTNWIQVDHDMFVGDDREGNGVLHIDFDSAWNPPIGMYDMLIRQGFTVDAMYIETLIGFYGYYRNGNDESYDYDNLLEVPKDIIVAFGIDEQEEYSELLSQ